MSKAGVLSTKYEDFAISRKKSVKAVVTNERAALASLKVAERFDYIVESISPEALCGPQVVPLLREAIRQPREAAHGHADVRF